MILFVNYYYYFSYYSILIAILGNNPLYLPLFNQLAAKNLLIRKANPEIIAIDNTLRGSRKLIFPPSFLSGW